MIDLIQLLVVGFAFGASVSAGAYATMRLLRAREKPVVRIEGEISDATIVRLRRPAESNHARLIP